MVTRYPQKNVTWVDVIAPTQTEVRALMHEFGFHPNVAQELLCASAHSKVERYEDSIYLVLHLPTLRGSKSGSTLEIDIIIGRNYLITARYENHSPLHSLAKAFEVESTLGQSAHLHGGHLFAAFMRALYRALAGEFDAIKNRLLEIEERLFDGEEKQMVIEISQVGRIIYDFSKTLAPHEEMLRMVELAGERMFGREFALHMRGVMGEFEREKRLTDHVRESMAELRETNNSLLSAKQNEVMKNFTVIAFVFIPVSLIMGVYQMSLPGTPPADFWTILGIIGILCVLMYLFFKRKGWL